MSRQGGFTLIEVLLSSFIFMSVVTIAVGSFTSQIKLQSSSEAQRNVQQTSQAIIEAISRDLRTIEEFDIRGNASCSILTGSSIVCGDEIEFAPVGAPRKRYARQGDTIRLCNPGCGQNQLNDDEKVEVLDFRVEGIEPNLVTPLNQQSQPFVSIRLEVRTTPTGRPEEAAELTVQTMVTSRLFDKYR